MAEGRRAIRHGAALACTVVCAAGALVLVPLNGGVVHGATATWNGLTEVFTWVAPMTFASVLGVLIAARRPGNPLAVVFLAVGLAGSFAALADQYAGYALVARPGSVPFGVGARICSFVAFALSWFLGGVLIPALFPNGRLVSRRWRFGVWLGALGAFAWSLLVTLPNAFEGDEFLGNVPGVSNPLAVPAAAELVNAVSGFGVLALFAGMFLAVISMVVRALRSHGDERQQVKVVAYTVAIVVLLQLIVANIQEQLGLPYAVFSIVSFFTTLAVPASIAIAVLRYRLYDVDRWINRTVVYLTVMAILAGFYTVVIVSLGSITNRLVGGSDLAVAGATLVSAALFTPVRRGVQRFVDKRFYRTRYDAQQTTEEFIARLRTLADLAMLRAELEAVAHKTMRPSTVMLWLPPERPSGRVLR